MKPYHAILLFALLVGAAVWSGMHGYRQVQRLMVADMNQALAQTLATKRDCWLTPDTIADYRSYLKTETLRRHSIVYYAMDNPGDGLCSRPMGWHGQNGRVVFQSYANCSVASVLALSDRRLPFSLSAMALLWAVFSLAYFRRHGRDMIVLGQLMLRKDEDCFYNLHHEPVGLTPMQHRLMRLFFEKANHQLGKQEICDALWPKKPDASETLYTLVRRLKPVIEKQGGLKIMSERGGDYQLLPGDKAL
ncbi:helix-turn-helix domain-containing protein [Prevotella sp. A2931]|uniref:Helix-turn-helix domain-containing protein n=1 Tax=Prevotella illustrans TaxID=2800387 RepID=A0ABS3M5Y2_9BACT|nr:MULTISPECIES: helix-turn-helix domain-containing protein [Prevotella]MBO1363589.1 helix-turn-helix domain-containing protein [Prevotella illustrans]PTL27308.1 transcriptional regulator [Prevotella sp. oral taxon 820]